MIAYAEKHFAEARSLSESDDCVSGYGNDQSYDRHPALREIQSYEADGGTPAKPPFPMRGCTVRWTS